MKKFALLSLLFLSFPAILMAESLRISPQQLNDKLAQYIILDVRSSDEFEAGHIQGALNLPVALSYAKKKNNGKISSPVQMQAILRSRGIEKNSTIVIYDGGNLVDAARIFWTLEVYNITNVKVLEHGYDFWLLNNYPISFDSIEVKPSKYIASINHQRIASKFTTQIATKNPNQYIIDARPGTAYNGETSVAKRFGHIPTAVSYPASHNIELKNGFASLKTIEAFKSVYADVPKKNKVVIYCAIGRVSAANYFALRELGYDVANYDSSWKEWGNDFSLPIENPSL